MPITSASNAVNLDTLINNTYEQIYDESAKDLKSVADQIDANTAQKQNLRDLQTEFDLLKNKVKNASTQDERNAAAGAVRSFMNKIGADYPNTKLAEAVDWNNMPGDLKWDHDGDGSVEDHKGAFLFGSGKNEKWDEWFGPIENALKNEMDARSDISSKLQVEINSKSSIARRAEKAISDNVANVQRNAGQIAGNLKG